MNETTSPAARPHILLTAFEPYGRFEANSSWLALIEMTRDLPPRPRVTTRRYPVDYDQMYRRLAEDLAVGYDFAIHLGQSPGASCIKLEAFALNVRTAGHDVNGHYQPVCPDGPAAYRSPLPLERLCGRLREAAIPASISHHAGTYLCNATLYWSLHLSAKLGLSTQAGFVHLPLDVGQALREPSPPASLPTATAAEAIRLLLAELVENPAASLA